MKICSVFKNNFDRRDYIYLSEFILVTQLSQPNEKNILRVTVKGTI